MSSDALTCGRPLTRDESGALFGWTMGLVAATAAVFAVGVYVARDRSPGWSWLFLAGSVAASSACR